jgi:exodeoxyribonuclease V alpha subunit
MDRLLFEKRLVAEIEGIYLPSFLETERYVAKRLISLSTCSVPDEPVTAYEEALLAELDENQRQAVRMAFTSGCLIVTGGPGTGKTTLVRHICRLARLKRYRILLCAPTGRAARRLEEATGHTASTIHRLLEFNPMTMTFERNESNTLAAELVVVDETSMVDLPLMGSLLAAIQDGCRLLLVGDADQLPPVGPGAVLREALASNAIPSIRLTEVYRQAMESLIVVNAHRVNRGLRPIADQQGSKEDYYFIKRNDPEEIINVVLELVVRRIPDRLHVNPIEDIQVVSPMRRGSLGTEMLNRRLQSLLNPHGDEVTRGSETFRVRDRVMQIKNNYKKLIFNGEQGSIQSIDAMDRTLRVSFDERIVEYEFGELDELTLAYASTVHKAQGSEYPAVVVILHTQHYIMLRRNLFYTALTRGRRLVTVVGSPKAVALAVQNEEVDNRYSNLSQRLLRGE